MKNDKDINNSLSNIKKHCVKKGIVQKTIRLKMTFLLEDVIEKKILIRN